MSCDKGTRPVGRPKSEGVDALVQKFLAMPVNDSFFVEGAKPHHLQFLRKKAVPLGANIEMLEVQSDEIYQLPGVRVWRRQGLIDIL